ncbi:WbqC family protein [Leptospira sp. GIMC2001]|uniref:WbqC family protein n=1 Tax=Leptospira sp. GIMC2001 TaxID=1513297 RepID=UPI00234B0BAF|nr:WbqC family protein [Leptospira sp. GIMC2001]WCL51232.1 WbqC family protein [Leptospira sp. GIMC2001]
MIVSINQPAYLPWLGYFHRIAISDIHIVLDHVQFEKNSFTNRNKIRTREGTAWLTVPVLTSGKFKSNPINLLEIDNKQKWAKKHLEAFKLNYRKARYFDEIFSFLMEVYSQEWKYLHEIADKLNLFILNYLNIKTKILYSSKMNIHSVKSDLVYELCKETGSSIYISGSLGRNYLEEDKFSQNNIKVIYHDYNHPTYEQIYPGFEPYMNIFDLLFNHGKGSMKILNSGFQLPQ